ncbi:MAG: aconitate hydratase AcnA [Legionellales bacterium]|nr:aconitate hydratase AcnA [Legionellales bacterium]
MVKKFLKELTIDDKNYSVADIKGVIDSLKKDHLSIPKSLKILLENVIRHFDNQTITEADFEAIVNRNQDNNLSHEIAYRPSRVLMQDFTGVPGVVDLAAMRDVLNQKGLDPNEVNPQCQVDLVIDHSVQVDQFASSNAIDLNEALEIKRNRERYELLKWGQTSFKHFRVVPPGAGICHQVNLEYLAPVVGQKEHVLFPDTLVGTDSHTTMINGLGVLGWGVGGIEAEAVMLNQPISLLIPAVVGVQLVGQLNPGVTATDLVLHITHVLRSHGVVGKFVEFYGDGLDHLTLAERATISNMAPEYGATCGFFPIDQHTIEYLKLTNRPEKLIQQVESYAKAQGFWREDESKLKFNEHLKIDLSAVQSCLAGPKRPQDKVLLSDLKKVVEEIEQPKERDSLTHGDVVLAAITSCTNTSNPSLLITAGLLAKAANQKGLKTKPWVKTSFAPGSRVVTEYMTNLHLMKELEMLGFHLVGYGCTTCIGNSGPLPTDIVDQIEKEQLNVASVLSGNRNFEGRIHPNIRSNWLASPPLVIAFALAGTTHIDLIHDPLGEDQDGHPVYLRDIWPDALEVQTMTHSLSSQIFQKEYNHVLEGNAQWQKIPVKTGKTFDWQPSSTYVRCPDFFKTPEKLQPIEKARMLLMLGDSVTTDHISPAGAIKIDSPAAHYLKSNGVDTSEFNTYGARRGNHEVMVRGTFANVRIRNQMNPSVEGGFTTIYPERKVVSIFEAAEYYKSKNTPLVVFAGKEYGTGSSRDWAAKGPYLLGVKAVICESFERIHRSNLVGMGILPCQLEVPLKDLNLTGKEIISIQEAHLIQSPKQTLTVTIEYENGAVKAIPVLARIDTENEVRYFKSGGILAYMLNQMK